MRTRSFHPVMAFITCMLMLFGLASGCVSDPVTITSNPVEEIDTGVSDTSSDVATQSVTISGHTATVDGVSLSEAWVVVANNATQQVVSETSSDESGAFTITFTGAVGDYDVLAAYQDDDVTLIGWQGFSISDEAQDYQFDLSLSEPPAMNENSDDGAAPPPSGGCYRVYFGSSWCSNHTLYRYYELSGAWSCSLVGAQVGEVGCC